MKIRVLILAIMIPFLGFSQTNKNDFVFEWQNNNSSLWISVDSIFKKFTPTLEEIRIAKQLSENHIDSLEKNRNSKIVKQYGTLLKYNSSNYYCQYVGYVDSNGNKIVLKTLFVIHMDKKVI